MVGVYIHPFIHRVYGKIVQGAVSWKADQISTKRLIVMEIKLCKTCGKQFLSEMNYSYCRICSKRWNEEQKKALEQAENLKWQEQKKHERELFEAEVQAYEPILMENIIPTAHTLYLIGNGFDLMHRVPSSYYNFRDSLGKRNGLRDDLEMALTAEDIWADFENALGTLNLDLMGSRDIIDMWLDNFEFYNDEESGAAEFYMAVEAAAALIHNIVSELQPAFRRWVEHLEVGTDDRPLIGLIHPQGKVLDFNYTEFIETLYGVKDVCYIHGSRKKKQKLILGHEPGALGNFCAGNKEPRNYRQAVIKVARDNVFDLIRQYDEDLTKNSQEIIKNHHDFFDGLASINQIVVVGHSISPVDWDYFTEVKKKAENAHWYFGIYGLRDLRNMMELVKNLNIKNYNFFRTDGIWTKPKKVDNGTALPRREVKPRVFRDGGITVTIRQTYDLMVGEAFEIILPYYAKNVVIFENNIFVILDDLIGNMLLFKRQEKDWIFVAVLESFLHQSLINRRLNHVFLEEDKATFVYNNRVRKYDLNTGKMIVNRQVRDAGSKAYAGKDVLQKFVGKVSHRNR